MGNEKFLQLKDEYQIIIYSLGLSLHIEIPVIEFSIYSTRVFKETKLQNFVSQMLSYLAGQVHPFSLLPELIQSSGVKCL